MQFHKILQILSMGLRFRLFLPCPGMRPLNDILQELFDAELLFDVLLESEEIFHSINSSRFVWRFYLVNLQSQVWEMK